jgi:hypothetical protein
MTNFSTGSDSGTQGGERSPSPIDGEDMWATRRPWGDDDGGDDDDYEAPRVNIVVRRAPSLASTDYARSVTSSSTTGTNTRDNMSHVSRRTAASRQPPGNTGSSAKGSSAASSVSGDAPAGAQSPVPGQRKSAWGTRGAVGSRPTAPYVKDPQDDDDVASTQSRPAPGQRQPAGKPRSPSSSTAASSVGSASSVSQASNTTSHRAGERDSPDSATLLDTASSAAGRDRPSSVARTSSSTSGWTAVSSEWVPAEGGFPSFDYTRWGDTISLAQRPKKSGKNGSNGGGSEEGHESEQNSSGTGKKYRARTKGRGGGGLQPQTDSLSVVLDIDLEPGGPGSAWGNGNEAW